MSDFPTYPPVNVPEALMPCPFCSSAAHFESDADGWHWIECESCGMQGNRAASLMEDCRPKLREIWNTRAGVHQDVASGYAQGWEDGMSEATALSAATPDVHELLEAASAVLAMCDVHGDFRNGVTDPTGCIDEGNVIAAHILNSLRKAIANVTDA